MINFTKFSHLVIVKFLLSIPIVILSCCCCFQEQVKAVEPLPVITSKKCVYTAFLHSRLSLLFVNVGIISENDGF